MSVEILAETVSAAAFVVGQATHQALSRKGHQESQPLIDQLNAPFQMETSTELQLEHNQKSNTARRVVRRVLAADVLLLTVTAGTGILGWNPHGDTRIKPTIEIAVDHSGQTTNPRTGEPTITIINKVLQQFDTKQVNSRAFVSHLGKVDSTSRLETVIKETDTIGVSDLDTATSQALDATSDIYAVNGPLGRKRSAAVVVITNNQSIGEPKRLIKQATQYGTPIFVVNVPGKNSQAATSGDLKMVASATGAKYWEITNKTPNIATVVEANVTGYNSNDSSTGDKNLLRLLSVMTGLGSIAAFRKTRYPWQGSKQLSQKAK